MISMSQSIYLRVTTIAALLVGLGGVAVAPAEEPPAPVVSAATLAASFAQPPDDARPWMYWFWINGNITKKGITADLEAMQRVGIGGVLLMEVTRGEPGGPVKFMSAQWRILFHHALQECARLGLKFNANNACGWSGSGGPWVPMELAAQEITISETEVTGGVKFAGSLPQPATKGGYYREIAVLAVPDRNIPQPAVPKAPTSISIGDRTAVEIPLSRIDNMRLKSVAWEGLVGASDVTAVQDFSAEEVIDLTGNMDADGNLSCELPPGRWTVIRFGHTFTGASPEESTDSGRGPECDKLSKAGTEANFAGMFGKLANDAGPLAGTVLLRTHIDSWEVGSQNWTPRMLEEFRRRRGYDLLRYLPVLTGRVVGNMDVSERFLWDFRKTISELVAENYVGRTHELAREHGLKLSMECYNTPGDDLDLAQRVDEPMAEFWWPEGNLWTTVKQMSSAAHVNNRLITAAEAFTAGPGERWLAHPGNLKALGDRALAGGINRFVIHRAALSPWGNSGPSPGMGMGLFGSHYDRTQTWWEYTAAWHQYLTRCQYLLRQGSYVADVLYLHPDEPMQRYVPPTLAGYGYDVVGSNNFLSKADVENRRVTFPGGASYRLLVLPNSKQMTLPMLTKIGELVTAGASILGEPPTSTPGLTDFPRADAELRRMACAIWDEDSVARLPPGKGSVFRGLTVEQALEQLNAPPDFTSDQPLHWIHRRSGDAEIYFLANPASTAIEALCQFRVGEKQPELWHPETGQVRTLADISTENGRTSVPLKFEATEAYFVVFRDAAQESPPTVSATKNGSSEVDTLPEPQQLTGPWELAFPTGSGAPASMTLGELSPWNENRNSEIKYFSGTATYSTAFEISAAQTQAGRLLFLDLGEVQVVAQVSINGKDLGVLWKAPFKLEITGAIMPGKNLLEVKVANLWVNRMIGDENLPEDSERLPNGLVKAWPAWLTHGKPSPAGRRTFTSWRLWKKGEALVPSGLLGPVQILSAQELENR